MSFTTTYYHIIFRTYRSETTIFAEYERELYAYIFGIAKNLRCQVYRIGGMSDHVHLFVSFPSNLCLSDFVQRVKTGSSKWMKGNPHFPLFRGWSKEYAGFSYGFKDKDLIIKYIINQKDHHKTRTFAEEYRAFLIENGVEINEQYFMVDE